MLAVPAVPQAAREFFLQAHQRDAQNAFTLNNLGYIAELQGQLDRATGQSHCALGLANRAWTCHQLPGSIVAQQCQGFPQVGVVRPQSDGLSAKSVRFFELSLLGQKPAETGKDFSKEPLVLG